jgi:hypothetical protein
MNQDMLQRVQKAKEMGFTDEQIQSRFAARGATGTQEPKKKGFLESLIAPFVGVGKSIGGGAFAIPQVALSGALEKSDPQLAAQIASLQNPFLSNEDLNQADRDPLGYFMDKGLKPSAGVASYAVPFGKGANILTKFLAPGALAGGASAFSNDEDILKGAAFGAGGAGVLGKGSELLGGVAEKLFGKAGGALEKGGSELIASQYNVPRSAARALDLPGTVSKLSEYGINNINDIAPLAEKITGSGGLITDLTKEAVKGAGKVNLSGVTDLANEIVANPAISGATEGKFSTFIEKGVKKLGTNADPSETFKFIQQLEKQASTIDKIPAFQRTLENSELSKGYRSLAETLKTRLFDEAGANSAVAGGLLTPQQLEFLGTVNPKLANDIVNAKTVGELRKVAEPFVKGSQLAFETEAGSQIGFNNMGGAAKGIGKMIQNPLNLLAVPLGSDSVNAGAGGFLKKLSEKMPQGLPAASSQVTGQFGAQVGSRMGQGSDIPQPASGAMPSNQMSDGGVQMGGGQDDKLRQTIASIMFSKAKSVNDIKAAYEMLQGPSAKPLSAESAKLKANVDSGLRALNKLETTISSNPEQLYLAAIPGSPGARTLQAAKSEVADVLARLRTGAAISKEEEDLYRNQLSPAAFDDPQTIQYKLNSLRNLLNSLTTSDMSAPQATGYDALTQ